MAGSTNRQLYLQVGADVSSLTTQMKAGRTALLTLSDAAGDVQAEVNKALANVAADPNALKQIEASYKATFDNIRKNAQAALAVNDNASALKLIDSTGAQQAAAAAQAQASQLRLAADAAAAVAERQGEAGIAARVLAAAFEVQAVDAAKVAAALRTQADVLVEVASEARLAGAREDELGGAHARIGSSGLIADHVVRSLSDSIAAGQSPVRALTMEMGRIVEAMQLLSLQSNATEGAMARFAGFMGGPWGLAITVGVAVLTPLIAKLFEGNQTLDEAVKKLKDDATQTALTDAAHRAFSRTIEGETADQKKLNDELDRQVRTQRQNQQNTVFQAQQQVARDQQSRPALVKDISTQQAVVDNYKSGNLPAGVDPSDALAAAAAAEAKLAKLKMDLAKNDQDIATGLRTIREAEVPLISSDVAAAFDGKTAAALRYEKALGQLNNRFAIGAGNRGTVREQQGDGSFKDVTIQGIGQADYQRQLTALQATKKREEEEAAAAKKAADDTSQVGVVATVADATRIIESIGGQVTSGFRSRAQQEQLYADKEAGRHDGPVARPGTSDHERGQAIDVGYGPGISIGTIKAAFKEAGVHINQLIDEPGQRAYHVGFGAKGPSDDTLAKRQQAQINKAANDDRAFQNADRQASDAIAKAKLQLGGSLQNEYQLKLQEIAADLSNKNRAVQDEVTSGRLTQARADRLKDENDQTAILEEQIAAEKLRVDQANVAYQDDKDARAARLALLQIDDALATTRAERLKIERQILDEQQAQQRSDAQHGVDVAKPGSPEQQRAQAALGRVPAQQSAENKKFDADHLDPLAAYKKQLQTDTSDMNNALKSIEADGLKSVSDGLVGIITGTETVASAFKKMAASIISDIVRIAAEKAILSILGLSTGGQVGSITPDAKAVGGAVVGRGSGTSDSILSWLSNGEFVMNAAATQKHLPLLHAMNDNTLPGFAEGGLVGGLRSIPTSYPALPRSEQLRNPAQHVSVSATVDVNPSPLFETQTRTIAQQTVGQAAMPIMLGATAHTVKKLRRLPLPGTSAG